MIRIQAQSVLRGQRRDPLKVAQTRLRVALLQHHVEVPVAVNCVAETNVVGSAVLPNITFAPFTKFVPPTASVKLPTGMGAGETLLTVGTEFSTVSALVPVIVVSVVLVAVTVSVFGLGKLAGALYSPALVIVPSDALPPATPFTDQVTVWFRIPPPLDVPLTVAVNCWVVATDTLAVTGLTATTPVLPTLIGNPLDVAVPGLGFTTATFTVVPFCAAVALPVAVNCVADTNVVVSV